MTQTKNPIIKTNIAEKMTLFDELKSDQIEAILSSFDTSQDTVEDVDYEEVSESERETIETSKNYQKQAKMNSEERMKISVADLRRLLETCIVAGYINEFAKDRIIEMAKGD